MEEIVKKAKKDFIKFENKPKIDDIFSFKGFLRYFLYRNFIPSVRDVSYFVISTLEIILLFKLLGESASSGGILAYGFILAIGNIWRIIVYTIREKILELNAKNKLNLIPNFFMPLIVSGFLIWLVFVFTTVSFIELNSTIAKIIFIHKLVANFFGLFSTLYFFSTYTLSRIYMSLKYTLGAKIFGLAFAFLLFDKLGVYSFILSFYITSILDLLVTIFYSKKVLDFRNIKLIDFKQKTLFFKNLFWFLYNKPSSFIKRFVSFFLINSQKLIVLILVNKYFPFYLLDFFLFYQLVRFFTIPAIRISKSLYYDTTNLLFRKKFNIFSILFNKNFIIVSFLAFIAVSIFYFLPTFELPSKWFSLLFEFIILDKWYSLYFLIFFTYGIKLFNRFFLVSESFYTVIFTSLIFNFLLLSVLLLNDPIFIQSNNPIMFFYFKGLLSPFYFLILVSIYYSGFWKKDSSISNIKDLAKSSYIDNKIDFLDNVDSIGRFNSVIIILVLNKRYSRSSIINGMLEFAFDRFDIRSSTRISRNTVFLVFNDERSSIDELKLKAITKLGFYCDHIFVSRALNLSKNIKAEKLFDLTFSSLRNLKFTGTSLNYYLKKERLIFCEYKVRDGLLENKKSLRKKEIFNVLNFYNTNFFPENLIFKKDYIGILPVIENFKIVKIIEFKDIEFLKFKKFLRVNLLNDLSQFIKNISND